MLSESVVKKLGFNTTFKWYHRVTYKANDTEDQLTDQIKQAKYFLLQIVECTYTKTKDSNHSVDRWFEQDGDMKNESPFFFSCSWPKDINSSQKYKAKKIYIVNRYALEFMFYVEYALIAQLKK